MALLVAAAAAVVVVDAVAVNGDEEMILDHHPQIWTEHGPWGIVMMR